MFPTVKLTEDEAKRMRDLNDRTISVQRAVQMFQETSERRLLTLQQEGQQFWTELASKYNLDLKHVEYRPSDDGTSLVPLRAMLQGATQ